MRLEDDVPVWKVLAVVIGIFIMCGLVGLGMVLFLPRPSWAEGPASKWGHDPATSEWFRNLRSPTGFPCCDYTDGTRIEDPGNYQENDDGSYDVRVGDNTVHVPKEKIVTAPNRVRYAILWAARPAPGQLTVYCFMPGARG